jgi:hypothetical protein
MKGCYGIYCSLLFVDQNRLSTLLRAKYGFRLPAEVRIFPYTTTLRPRLWPTHSSNQQIQEDLSPLAIGEDFNWPRTTCIEYRSKSACGYTATPQTFIPRRNSPRWVRACSVSRLHDHSHLDTPHLVGLLWTSDQPDAETSTWQHTTLTRDRLPFPGGIRTHNPSKRATANPRLRPRG